MKRPPDPPRPPVAPAPREIRVTVQDGVSPKPEKAMKPAPPPPPPKKK